jgi:hypothetical protein
MCFRSPPGFRARGCARHVISFDPPARAGFLRIICSAVALGKVPLLRTMQRKTEIDRLSGTSYELSESWKSILLIESRSDPRLYSIVYSLPRHLIPFENPDSFLLFREPGSPLTCKASAPPALRPSCGPTGRIIPFQGTVPFPLPVIQSAQVANTIWRA